MAIPMKTNKAGMKHSQSWDIKWNFRICFQVFQLQCFVRIIWKVSESKKILNNSFKLTYPERKISSTTSLQFLCQVKGDVNPLPGPKAIQFRGQCQSQFWQIPSIAYHHSSSPSSNGQALLLFILVIPSSGKIFHSHCQFKALLSSMTNRNFFSKELNLIISCFSRSLPPKNQISLFCLFQSSQQSKAIFWYSPDLPCLLQLQFLKVKSINICIFSMVQSLCPMD